MKLEAKAFIKQFSLLNYPAFDKSELATIFLYNALMEFKDKENLKINSSVIEDITNSNACLREVYDDLIYSYLSKKDFKELSIECINKFRSAHYINNEVYKLITKFLNLKSTDTLLHINAPDEAFLVEASSTRMDSPLKLSTLVIPDNATASNLIKMRLELNDTTCTIVDKIDTVKKFKPNKIFINPTYKILDKTYKYSTKNNYFWDELLEIMDIVSKDAKVIALVPNVMLSNSLDKEKKGKLISKGYIEGIVSIPLRYYSNDLKVEVSLLVLSKSNSLIKIVDINSVFSLSDIKSAKLENITDYIFENYQSNFIEVQGEDLLKKDSNLLISNIITEDTYDGMKNLSVLSGIANVSKGLKKTKASFNDVIDQSGKSKYCLLSSNDIKDGMIDYDSLTRIIYSSNLEKYVIKNGDIVFTNKSSKVKLAVIECEDLNIIPVGSMIIVSPQEKKLDGTYLKMFFDSDKGVELLSKVKRGQRTNTLNPNDLKILRIPYMNYYEQLEYSKLYKSKMNELVQKKVEIKAIEDEIRKIINGGT